MRIIAWLIWSPGVGLFGFSAVEAIVAFARTFSRDNPRSRSLGLGQINAKQDKLFFFASWLLPVIHLILGVALMRFSFWLSP